MGFFKDLEPNFPFKQVMAVVIVINLFYDNRWRFFERITTRIETIRHQIFCSENEIKH